MSDEYYRTNVLPKWVIYSFDAITICTMPKVKEETSMFENPEFLSNIDKLILL